MKREAYEGFKLATGIALFGYKEKQNLACCFDCHQLPSLGRTHRDSPVPTLRNRSYTREQFDKMLNSPSHKEYSIDEATAARLYAFVRSMKDVPDPEFRPLILNASVLDTTGDIE